MPVPSYQTLMRPTLETLAEHGELQFRTLMDLVAHRIGLSDEDRLSTTKSGEPVMVNRAGWALIYLVQAGAARRPKRGFSSITERGTGLLRDMPGLIGNTDLQQFAEFQAFLARSATSAKAPLATISASGETAVPAGADYWLFADEGVRRLGAAVGG